MFARLHLQSVQNANLRRVSTASEGRREQLPESAAALVDLAVRWTGPLAGATVEFVLDEHGRVRSWFAKTRGGRRELDATQAAVALTADGS